MSYKAEILADSRNPQGDRITTMKVTFPRMMLAEMNTHRMFSRNSASSRAIPFKKMVKMVEDNPFIPIAFQKDHKGMQGTEYFNKSRSRGHKMRWLQARDEAVKFAEYLNSEKVTKQLCNRLLEPFMWHTVIITATEWENFFKLRCPQYTFRDEKLGIEEVYYSKKDAIEGGVQPETGNTLLDWLKLNKSQADIHIQAIAELMWDAYNESEPKELKAGEWHIPFGDNIKEEDLLPFIGKFEVQSITHQKEARDFIKRKIAVARCARISYQTLGDDPKIDYKADIRLHDILAGMEHWSPFEHVAKAMSEDEYNHFYSGQLGDTGTERSLAEEGHFEEVFLYENRVGWCRNFRGFIQYRSLLDD